MEKEQMTTQIDLKTKLQDSNKKLSEGAIFWVL